MEGIPLLPGEAASWYVNVDQRYRGRRIHALMGREKYKKVKKLGCNTIIAHVKRDNTAAIKANVRFYGAQPNGRSTSINFLAGRCIIYVSSQRKCVALRLGNRNFGFGYVRGHGFKMFR
jgi:hypothetical protein